MKEKLNITKEQGRSIVWEDTPDYITVENKVTGTGRWSTSHRMVVQRKSDGKFFAGCYSVGATESQDERPFEYDNPDFIEVEKKEVLTVIYE